MENKGGMTEKQDEKKVRDLKVNKVRNVGKRPLTPEEETKRKYKIIFLVGVILALILAAVLG